MRLLITLTLTLMLTITSHAQNPTPPPDGSNPTFGVVEGMWFPEITCALGVGWERIIFNWMEHQPDGADDWYTLNVDDRWLKAASHCDREVVALLKHTPAWATDATPSIGVPRGLDLPIDDPDNTWAQFVYRTADYYATRGVNRFIIWNEPDIEPDVYGYEFEGTLEDYANMVRVAYLAARRANPASRIHLAGTTYWHDVNEGRTPYTERLIQALAQFPDATEHDHFFDVVSLHIYFRTRTVYDIVMQVRDMLARYDLDHKAIWINETNAAPTDDPDWQVVRPVFDLDLHHQASFMVQAAALALAAGVERVAAYKLYDQNLPAGAESFGLLSPPTAQPRPAYHAWQTVTRYFQHVQTAQLARTNAMTAVRLTHTNGDTTLVTWANTEAPVTIRFDTTADKLYRISQYGSITILRGSDNPITLPSAHCTSQDGCFIGGEVTLIRVPDTTLTIYQQTPNGDISLNFEQE